MEQTFKPRKLEVGETFLQVIVLGNKANPVPCFPQTTKDGRKYYKGDGVTVFVNKKKPEQPQSQVTTENLLA